MKLIRAMEMVAFAALAYAWHDSTERGAAVVVFACGFAFAVSLAQLTGKLDS